MKHSGTERFDTAGARPFRQAGGHVAAFLAVTLALACMMVPLGSAHARDAEGVAIAIPIAVHEGQSVDAAVGMMKEIAAFVAKQPGLIAETLLVSSFPNNRPSHLHVMRWQSVAHWEAVHNSPEFLSLVEKSGRYFDFAAAEVFTPVP